MAVKQAKNLGRLELLAWLNDLAETDYPKIEACSDAVGFCQVLDAIAPSSQVPLQRLRFNASNRDDKERNLKIFSTHVQKMRLPYQVDVIQLANGRFQHNMECVQFLYDHHMRVAPKAANFYNGFERRMEAYKKQNNIAGSEDLSKFKINMSSHLIPNKANCRTSEQNNRQGNANMELQIAQHETAQYLQVNQSRGAANQGRSQSPFNSHQAAQQAAFSSHGFGHLSSQEVFDLPDQVASMSQASSHYTAGVQSDEQDIINNSRQKQLQDLVQSLENELTTKLFQHKTFLEEIESVEEERNFYYQKLRDIELEALSMPETSQVANYVLEILKATPEDFKSAQPELPRRETFGRR